MTVPELKQHTKRVENMAKRGLLSVEEAERRLTQLIDETLPEQAFTTPEKWEKLMEQRRLANRRKWRFLLSLTKEKARV